MLTSELFCVWIPLSQGRDTTQLLTTEVLPYQTAAVWSRWVRSRLSVHCTSGFSWRSEPLTNACVSPACSFPSADSYLLRGQRVLCVILTSLWGTSSLHPHKAGQRGRHYCGATGYRRADSAPESWVYFFLVVRGSSHRPSRCHATCTAPHKRSGPHSALCGVT